MIKTSRAIIIEDNKLMTFYREKIKDNKKITYYAIPGGHVEDGESCEEAVIRELKEELNIDIEIIRYLGNIVRNDICEEYYLCRRISGTPILSGEEKERNCPNNYYEFRYFPLSNIDNSNIVSKEFIKDCING